jgi:hypothetical protein
VPALELAASACTGVREKLGAESSKATSAAATDMGDFVAIDMRDLL